MLDTPSAAAAGVSKHAPLVLPAVAVYLNFIGTYGAAIVVTMSMIYGVLQIVAKVQEIRARNKNKE